MTKIAREAIGAMQRVLDPRFREAGGLSRFRRERKVMLWEMTKQGELNPSEIKIAARTKPNMTEQEVRDWAYYRRTGFWDQPGAPENG